MRKLHLQILTHARSLARCNLSYHEHNSVTGMSLKEPQGATIAPAGRSDCILNFRMANQRPLKCLLLSRFAPLAFCESLFGMFLFRRNCPDSTAGTSTIGCHVSDFVEGWSKIDCRLKVDSWEVFVELM